MRQRKRLIINVLSNYTAFGVYGVVNIFLVGYVIRIIGKDAFGIVALVMSLIAVTELLGRGVGKALTKYVAGEASKGELERVRCFVNTTLVWLFGCGVIGAVICIILAGYIDRIAQIPEELVPDARGAMWLMGLRVFLCFPFNTFQSLLWGYQRYDLTNLARIVTVLLRAALVIAWFELVSAGVVELVAITIVSLLVERVLWVMFALRIAPKMQFAYRLVSLTTLGTLVGFGGLMLIIDVANMIGYEVVKWVVAIKLPVRDVGAFAVIGTLAAFAGTMARSIAQVLVPAASRFDALSQHEMNDRLGRASTKYATIVGAGLCIAPLPLLRPFLTHWVGDAYTPEYLRQLAWAGTTLLLGQWFVGCAVCLLQMLTGVGRVAFPATVTLCWSVGGVTLVWVALHWAHASILGVSVLIATARAIGSVVHFVYGARVLRCETRDLVVGSVVRPLLAGVLACAGAYLLAGYLDVYRVTGFVGAALALAVLFTLAVWGLALSSGERAELKHRIGF